MSVPGKSLKWELKHSLYILLALVPFVPCAPFFYISNRVNKRSYKILSYVYLAFTVLLIVFAISYAASRNVRDFSEILGCILNGIQYTRNNPAGSLLNIWRTVMLGIQLFAVIQTLIIRPKYLKELTTEENQQIVSEGLKQNPVSSPARPAPVSEKKPAPSAAADGKININTCTEQELSSLPGLSIIDAKKAMQFRETEGDFSSVEEFIMYLKIKPHIAVQLHELLTAELTSVKNAGGKPRTLDL